MAIEGKTRGYFPAQIAILCSLLRPGWHPPQPSIKQVLGGLSPGVKRGRVFVALCHSPPNTSSWSAVKTQGRLYIVVAMKMLLQFCCYCCCCCCFVIIYSPHIIFLPSSVTKF